MLFEQSKLASMGEMIGNIAHQWRQPLSIVSSASTGLKLQKQLCCLSDEQFFQTCDVINDNAQYLSKTIDDFRDFIKGNRKKSTFLLSTEFDKFVNLINPSIKSHNIKLQLNVQEGLEIYGFSNELLQCFLNIYYNAKDALKNINEDSRIFIIDAIKEDNKINIYFSDSGGGIEKSIINNIFEPYFTTKHQKQGTGLGLHMTYNMIQGMNGTIEASNKKFIFNEKEYYGAVLKISFHKED